MRRIGAHTLARPVLALGTAGFLVGMSHPRPIAAQAADSSTSVFEVSHLTVVQHYRADSRIVAVRLYLLGGTRQVAEETAGIELLLLRAAQLGAGGALARTGSRPVLDATPDWTVVGFAGLRDDLDSAWAGLAQEVARPGFSDAALERARGELVARARRRETEPDARIRADARKVAFQGHPYALDPEGTVASLSSLSRADLERYWEESFVTTRMLLVVVGAVPRARIESLVRTTLGRLPQGAYAWTLPPPLPTAESRLVWWYQPLPTNYLLGYFPGPIPTDSDYFEFQVALRVLSGELNTRLREEEAISYAAYAPFLDFARPAGGIYTSTPDPARAIRVIRRTLSGLADLALLEGPAGLACGVAVDRFELEELAARTTSEGEADALARAYLFFGDIAGTGASARKLRRVGCPSIGDVMLRYVKHVQFVFLGDTAQLHGLR